MPTTGKFRAPAGAAEVTAPTGAVPAPAGTLPTPARAVPTPARAVPTPASAVPARPGADATRAGGDAGRSAAGPVLLLVVLAGGAGAVLPSFSPVTYAVVAGIGVLAMGLAFWPSVRRAPAPARLGSRGWRLWAFLFAAFLLWELSALWGGHPEQPTFSALMDPILAEPGWRGLFWIGWLLAGWGLIRR